MQPPSRFTLSLSGEFWLAVLLVIFTTLSIRLTELPLWNDPAFFVNGERLMATHDAYVWLAGIKGIGNYVSDPFAHILATIHTVFGIPVDVIGFWSPVVFIPLLAFPICFLARSLKLPEGGLAFGILATSGLGFLVRTRLGFCDTDVINLLFPVSMICVFVVWLDELIQSLDSTDVPDVPVRRSLGLALLSGVCGKIGLIVYPGCASLVLPAMCIAALLGGYFFRMRRGFLFGNGFLLILGLCFGGWIGALLALLWCGFWAVNGSRVPAKMQIAIMLALLAVSVGGGSLASTLQGLVYRLFLYAKIGTPDMMDNATGLKLPDIAQSVREAQNLDWTQLAFRLGGNGVVFFSGVAGLVFVSWRRPALLLFLPFLGLGLASVKLGNRFAMFGTVGVGMGLGLGLSELLLMLRQSQGRRWIAQLCMACVALWPSAEFMKDVAPVPVLPKMYAQTFLELKNSTEPNALLWQWWDYGYAGQYYAERATMGDGSRHDGPILFPLAKAHMASTPRQARQIMQYFGKNILNSGQNATSDIRAALLLGDPLGDFRKSSPAEGKRFLASLGSQEYAWADVPPQYFVLSWENLRLAGWIGYYGNWDIETGTSSPGRVQQLSGDIRVDTAAGALVVNGKSSSVDSVDLIEVGGARVLTWPNGTGTHVVINQLGRQVLIMDTPMYQSMMVRMLLHPPQDFAADFTLVVDKYPWARVYKVKS